MLKISPVFIFPAPHHDTHQQNASQPQSAGRHQLFSHDRNSSIMLLIALLTLFMSSTICSNAQPLQVSAVQAKARQFSDLLKVQGNVESTSIARVSPRIPGPIEAIFVKEGDLVEAGKTRLFVIDPLKLEKNVEIRQQELAIANLSLKEKEVRLKQARADLEKARLDVNRFRLLWEDNSTSQDNYEKAQLKFSVSEATVEHTQALIELDKEQLKKARLALSIAEKDFADSTVMAPISGRVSTRLQEPGEMAAPGKPILVIKDPEDTEVSAFIPAEYYHRVITGTTRALIKGYADQLNEAVVTFKSPEILPELRTFQIKCHLPAVEKSMVPGTLAEITLILETRTGLAVPTAALLNRNNEKVVFVAENGKAVMKTVKTGLENDGSSELTAGDIKEGSLVINRGQHLLNDGQTVEVSSGDSGK